MRRSRCSRRGGLLSGARAAPWLAGGAGLFLIGTSAPAAAVLETYPIFGGQLLRSVLAAVLLLAILGRPAAGGLVRPTGGQLLRLAGLGTVGIAGFNLSVVTAVRHADPAVVGAIIAATPVLIAVLGPLQARRRPRARVVLGCGLIAAGTAVASGFGSLDGIGALLCTSALGCEVAFSLLAAALVPALGALRTTGYAMAASIPVLAPAGLLIEGPAAMLRLPDLDEGLALAYLVVPIAVIANLCWYFALRHLPTDRASLCYATTPLGALLAAVVVAAAVPTEGEVLGIILVAAGLLTGLAPPRPPAQPPCAAGPRALAGRRLEGPAGQELGLRRCAARSWEQ